MVNPRLVFTAFISIAIIFFTNIACSEEEGPVNHVVPLMDVQVPLIPNLGQFDSSIKYSAGTFLGQVLISESNLTYVIPKFEENSLTPESGEIPAVILRESFVGVESYNLTSGTEAGIAANFYNQPEAFLSDVTTYQEVKALELWPGINLTLRAGYSNLEKIFEVEPGIDTQQIQISFEGHESLSIDSEGQLEVETGLGIIRFSAPIAWQQLGSEAVAVEVQYRIVNQNVYGFTLGEYNSDYPVLIDPLIVATYIGGTGTENLNGIAKDSSGNVYVVGNSSVSNGLTGAPYTPPGPGVGTVTAGQDVVVFKLNPQLTSLTSWAVLGGTGTDVGRDIAVSPAGDVYVLSTCTALFPTTIGAYDTLVNSTADICISRLTSGLNTLTASTFIGGSAAEVAGNILYDNTNNRVIISGTAGAAYPVTCTLEGVCTAFQAVASTSPDFVLSVFNPSLSTTSLLSSTYYGGTGTESIPGLGLTATDTLALDSAGNIIFTGLTGSSGLASIGGYDSTAIAGTSDAIIAKFSPSLSLTSRIGATYYAETSGATVEAGYAVEVDSADNIYMAGTVAANTVPTTFGAYSQFLHGTTDIILTKFNSTLSSLLAGTFLGGTGVDTPTSLSLDSNGKLIITGNVSAAIATNPTACYPTFVTSTEGVVIKISTDLATAYQATYFAGTGANESVNDLIMHDDLIHFVGNTNTTGLSGGVDTVISGIDGFIARMDADLCVAPAVINITSSVANGTYGIGDIIPIDVVFTGPVNAIGIPALTLETGTTDQVINYSSGTGTATLTFNYTVVAGDSNADLDYLSTSALSTIIQSIGGTAANLTLFDPGNEYSLSHNKNIVIDGTAPSIPSVSAPLTGSQINDSTPTIAGLAEVGATVNVNNGMLNLCSVIADSFGVWSCTLPAQIDATYNLSITATDTAGNDSSVLNYSLIIDTVAPSGISISDPTALSITSDQTYTVIGTTEAFAEVVVTEGANTLCNTVANAIGDWTCTTISLIDGPHTIIATATDNAENTLASGSTTFSIDTVAPNPIIISVPSNNFITNDSTPLVSGVGETGTTIEVKEGTDLLCSTVVIAGAWSCSSTLLLEGTHLIFTESVDLAGNMAVSSSISFDLDLTLPNPPIITSPVNNTTTSDTTPLISGSAEANSIISIYDGITLLGTSIANGSGDWSYASVGILSDGVHSINVQAKDSANNDSAMSGINLIIDTTSPIIPSINLPLNGSKTNDTSPELSGLAEVGTTVSVNLGLTTLCTDIADGLGSWSCTLPAQLDGEYIFNVFATDDAGNNSLVVNSNFEIDTLPPTSVDILDPSELQVTSDNTYGITGTTEGLASITVSEGLNILCSTNADLVGAWTCNTVALVDGAHSIIATATDAAGNSVSSSAVAYSVDTVAPNSVVITNPVNNFVTNNSVPNISGVGETGVNIEVNEGGTTLCSTTVTAGAWSCTSSVLTDGSHDLFVEATDAASNNATGNIITLNVDTSKPSAPIISSPSNNSNTEDRTPLFVGTAEVNSVVSIYDGAVLLGTTNTNNLGAWVYASGSALTDGAHNINIRATDSAGNESESTAITLNVISFSNLLCQEVNYNNTLSIIDRQALKLNKRVASAGRLNRQLARAGICKRVTAQIKNANRDAAELDYADISFVLANALPQDQTYQCASGLPAGCSAVEIQTSRDKINARSSNIENLINKNLGNCRDLNSSALSQALRARKLVMKINSSALEIPVDLSYCPLS